MTRDEMEALKPGDRLTMFYGGDKADRVPIIRRLAPRKQWSEFEGRLGARLQFMGDHPSDPFRTIWTGGDGVKEVLWEVTPATPEQLRELDRALAIERAALTPPPKVRKSKARKR